MGISSRTTRTANRSTVLCSCAAISQRRLALRDFENCATARILFPTFSQESCPTSYFARDNSMQNMLCCW